MCIINESHERNIPEVTVWTGKRKWISLSPCTIAVRIMRVNRALSQVSTSFSIYTSLLQAALKGCRRREELFQASCTVNLARTSIVPTNGNYKDTVNGHTGVLHRFQRAMSLGERPHTHLMLLARQPRLVDMTWRTMSRHHCWEILWVWRRERRSCAHICDSGERWLIINCDEQHLDITTIDPTVRPVVARHSMTQELRPRLCTRIKMTPAVTIT